MQCKCEHCGKVFDRKKYMIARSKHTYCSHKCADEHGKLLRRSEPGYLNYECCICGKKFHLNQYEVNHGMHCCSKECRLELRRKRMSGKNNHQYGLKGPQNASWKGGRKVSTYGYILIWMPEHPFANGDGNVFEHRIVAEQYLLTSENSIEINGKRYLNPEYSVHHKDENRQNNAVENLVVMKKGEHVAFHNLKNPVNRNPVNGRFIAK